MFRGFVIPAKGLDVVLRLTASLLGQIAELVLGVGVAAAGSAAIPGECLGAISSENTL